jgi:hypothetical protein
LTKEEKMQLKGKVVLVSLSIQLLFTLGFGQSGRLANFSVSPYFAEQIRVFKYPSDVTITINAPCADSMRSDRLTSIVLYALPNDNSTAWTIGKEAGPGEDWHYEIQHIGAQTRFLRKLVQDRNIVTVYLENEDKSWPKWSDTHASDKYSLIYAIVDSIRNIFADYPHEIVINGHSGGGAFEFNFINGQTAIPSYVKRIAFIDSEYNYSDALLHGDKLAQWLNASTDNYLCVLAYNDSVALYEDAPVVSATGGTWYRSKMMQRKLAEYFTFTFEENDDFLKWTALSGRVQFWLKKNPTQAILHTVQVERNGYIHTVVSGTGYDQQGYVYYGNHVYDEYVQKLPPEDIGSLFISKDNSGQLCFHFNSVEHGDIYRVFWSTDGVNFADSVDITDSSYVATGLAADSLYFFRVQGVSYWGKSGKSEVLAGVAGAGQPDVLIINAYDDTDAATNTHDFVRQHASAFAKNGRTLLSASNDAFTSGKVNAADYALVDFLVGADYYVDESISPDEQALLTTYLQNGGKLLISGSDLLFDMDKSGKAEQNEFCYNFLKSFYFTRSPLNTASTYYQLEFNTSWTDQTGIFTFDDGTHGTYNVKRPDAIKPINGGKPYLFFNGVDTTNGVAGVTYSGLFPDGTVPGKIFVMSVPIETIYPDSARAEFVGTVLTFFSSENEIQTPADNAPANFALEPNYPNPFNGSTRIVFSLPSASRAKIAIYNSLGQVICNLTDSVYSAGKHELVWDTKNVSTGVYFYRLETPEHSAVRKMILLK